LFFLLVRLLFTGSIKLEKWQLLDFFFAVVDGLDAGLLGWLHLEHFAIELVWFSGGVAAHFVGPFRCGQVLDVDIYFFLLFAV